MKLETNMKTAMGKYLFAGLVLLALTLPGHAQLTFSPATTYTVGSDPRSVVVADVNGDGKPDLICANAWDNTLSVLTNNGSGSFGINATIDLIYDGGWIYPHSVIAADINGDGYVDLIYANTQDNTLTVLTNNGSGGFGFNATLNVGAYPVYIVAADVNGDGKLDLISANYAEGTLSVLTNNGNGGFGSNATLNVGRDPDYVVAADVNDDGKLDLICANEADASLMVWTNGGTMGFVHASTLDVGSWPRSIAVADINGDGKPDLICANFLGGDLTLLTNVGGGGFDAFATAYIGGFLSSVVAADLNGDGKVDLFCVDSNSDNLTVVTNDGTGNFTIAYTMQVGFGPSRLIAADVNGDGRLDLITSNEQFNNTLSVLVNTSTFPPPASMPPLTINQSRQGVSVSWPSAAAGWSLQQGSDLKAANWFFSGYSGHTITDDGKTKSLTTPALPGNTFFRLMHP